MPYIEFMAMKRYSLGSYLGIAASGGAIIL